MLPHGPTVRQCRASARSADCDQSGYNSLMARLVPRSVLILVIVMVLATIGASIYVRSQFRASLAQLDGTATIASLTASVRVDRDSLGVPTITGRTREDVARALGFLHAQDRFFQMDLQRR